LRLDKALAEVVSSAGVPYGYTLAIWSTGALSIGRFGIPNAREVFLFLAGGSLAYVLLAMFVSRGRVVRATRAPAALLENVFAVPAVGVAYALGLFVGSASASFFLLPMAATVVYMLGLTVLTSRVVRREDRAAPRSSGPEPSP